MGNGQLSTEGMPSLHPNGGIKRTISSDLIALGPKAKKPRTAPVTQKFGAEFTEMNPCPPHTYPMTMPNSFQNYHAHNSNATLSSMPLGPANTGEVNPNSYVHKEDEDRLNYSKLQNQNQKF